MSQLEQTRIHFETPVRYPHGWAPTPIPIRQSNSEASPGLTFEEAIGYLVEELHYAGAESAVVHTQWENAGHSELRRFLGGDTGASVRFDLGEKRYLIACDRWSVTAQNLYALHLVLRHGRKIGNWGIQSLAAFLAPFEASRVQTGEGRDDLPDWMDTLGLGPTATLGDANAIYRHRAKAVAENDEALGKLNRAIEAARRALTDE